MSGVILIIHCMQLSEKWIFSGVTHRSIYNSRLNFIAVAQGARRQNQHKFKHLSSSTFGFNFSTNIDSMIQNRSFIFSRLIASRLIGNNLNFDLI